ncbi:MAG: site-specific integrase, partial [Pseudomonadota bacterium]
MPRRRKPARLYRRPDDGSWLIRDGTRTVRTGHSGDGGRDAAEAVLRRYLASRAPERIGPARPDEITCGEVLNMYVANRGGAV